MHLIVCLDDNNGMAFNGRRHSRDRLLTRKILETANGIPIWMSQYSSKMFLDAPEGAVIADDEYLEKAGPHGFCFVETADLTSLQSQVSSVIVFRWNRVYPADLWFPIDLMDGWKKYYSEDFQGSSHDKITKEMYIRNEENE